jgi:hypothetical protein
MRIELSNQPGGRDRRWALMANEGIGRFGAVRRQHLYHSITFSIIDAISRIHWVIEYIGCHFRCV